MKKLLTFLFAVAVAFGFSCKAQAALELRGTDSLGNRLIYDTDLDITWYDYTNLGVNYPGSSGWVASLVVDFGGTIYDDWRLPTNVDGLHVEGYDGSTTGGYNITSSEMGHLFYTELGNLGYYATDGTNPQPGWGLTNTGYFQHLQAGPYWSSNYLAFPGIAWFFDFYDGHQSVANQATAYLRAIAVRPGDVTVAVSPSPTPSPTPEITPTPEPSPSPTPTVVASPTAVPTPSPEPTSTYVPTPTPEASPSPTPQPSPTEPPTAIELVYFRAKANGDGSVTLAWKTASEVDNAGFNIYRSKRSDGTYKKVNGKLIPAQGGGSFGASYSYEDTPGRGAFYYKLEDVDSNGTSAMHGPVKIRVRSAEGEARRR